MYEISSSKKLGKGLEKASKIEKQRKGRKTDEVEETPSTYTREKSSAEGAGMEAIPRSRTLTIGFQCSSSNVFHAFTSAVASMLTMASLLSPSETGATRAS